jgi:hypothetical protein
MFDVKQFIKNANTFVLVGLSFIILLLIVLAITFLISFFGGEGLFIAFLGSIGTFLIFSLLKAFQESL